MFLGWLSKVLYTRLVADQIRLLCCLTVIYSLITDEPQLKGKGMFETCFGFAYHTVSHHVHLLFTLHGVKQICKGLHVKGCIPGVD